MRNRLAVGVFAGLVAATALTLSATHATATAITPNGSWPTYHHDDGHTGFDSSQPAATTATTGWTSLGLDGTVYAEPLVYQGIVYVATLNNTVYALNQTDGSQVWSTHLRAPQTTGWSCGNVSPQGILGTPVIDPATGRIYAATLGSDNVYRLEGLNLTTGLEELNTVITTPTPAFDWHIEQERGALAVRNGYVYVPFGGRAGDCGSYHGYVFAVPTNGTAVTHWYQTPGEGSGFWTAGGVVVDDSTGKVFETSGNGVASGCNSNPDGTPVFENDAVVRLSATLAHEDAFIPTDWQSNWCSNDQDLGSASMVLISPTLAFQAGKWGNGFLVNPQALGGVDGQVYPTPRPAGYSPADVCLGNNSDANFGSYAYAAPYVYLSCDANSGIGFTGRLVALKVDTATPSFSACGSSCGSPSWAAGSSSFGPPIVAGGAVWVVSTGGGGLYGFDAATGTQIYHSSGFSATHFTTPSEAGGQIFVGSGNVVRSFKMVSGCKSVTVSANPPSPAGTGTSVTLTAIASGCPNPNPDYQFWVLPPGGSAYLLQQAYSATATFTWNTSGLAPGDYRFSIWARDANSTGAYGNQFGRWDAYDNSLVYTLTTPTCSSLSASVSPPSPDGIGTAVAVSAQASGCADPNPLYQFWVLPPGGNAYLLQQAYSTNRTFSWNTSGLAPGDYRFSIWARDANSTGLSGNQFGRWDAYNNSILYTLTAPACSGLSAHAAPASPAGIGTTVTVTAQASGCTDLNPLYQFWVLAPGGAAYQLGQAYSTNSTFSWSTSGLAPGSYTFSIWTRDANSSGASGNQFGRWDAYNITTYTLTSCSSISATVLPPSPSGIGRTITVSVQAMGCPDPGPLYEFWVLAPGGNAYQLGQAYSTNSTFSWITSGFAPGSYTFSIWVRDANSSGASGNQFGRWDAYNITTYTLTSCSGLQLSVSPASPSASGTTVTVTAQASGCPDPNPQYEFWVLPPGGNAYQLVQAYSATSTVTWNTTGLAPGSYRFSVWVRDTNSAGAQGNQFGTWDAYNDYTVYSLS